MIFGTAFAFPRLSAGRYAASPGTAIPRDTTADRARYAQPESAFEYPDDNPPPVLTTPDILPGNENLSRHTVPANQPPAEIGITESENILPAPGTADSLSGKDSLPRNDSVRYNNFLDDIITSKNKDSLVYDVKNRLVYIYSEGDVSYQKMNLKADYIMITMDTKELYAHGIQDTVSGKTRPEFTEGATAYTMDTITYNINSKKAKIKGVASQEGEGFLHGQDVKLHDHTVHIRNGRYTTCDEECPHFYLRMTRAKVIPGDRIIVGFSHLVMEDVPIPVFIPEAFFPITADQSSGFIIPSYGEETRRGFFLRDGGYYFILSPHMDLTLLGGIYTKGSWESSASTRYVKRYKFSGNFAARYAQDVTGEKGDDAYSRQNNFRISWTHSQDPKARPNSTFSASVNFVTSGYNRNNAATISDHLNTQTNSSIAYSKSWAGTPFSISTSMSLSQNSVTKSNVFSFPNATISMSRINPFKRRNPVGKQRWYEKINMNYTGNISNSVTVQEEDLFTEEMFRGMNPKWTHSVPINTSMNIFNYINISPQISYNETWSIKKTEREWNPDSLRVITLPEQYGFFRTYRYSASVSMSTKIYGTFLFKSKTFPVQAIRHTLTPSVGMSYTPDFGRSQFGFYRPIQVDSLGTIDYYSPFVDAPGRGQNASLNFSLAQTLEAKVLSKTDTSGVKKVRVIDNFSFSGSYNFLADSLNLSMISLQLRMTIPFLKNFGLNLTATLDPYEVENRNGVPVRINTLMLRRGRIGRIASTGWQAGYTFNGGQSKGGGQGDVAINNITTHPPGMNDMGMLNPWYFDPDNPIDPALRREMMVSTYYDFSIPWNFGFNYSIHYTNNGVQKNVTQSVSFNGSVTLTPKWGITFNGGYDLVNNELTPGTFTLTRDLHCWQFNFNWVPIGHLKSWSFNISVKSAMLRDLKYDRSRSHYDNLYDPD